MAVKPIPDGYHSVTAYLSIKGAAQAIEFYKRAFGATEIFRLVAPGGEIGHAEIKIDDSPIMLADPCDEGTFRNPQSLGGSSVGLHVNQQACRGTLQARYRLAWGFRGPRFTSRTSNIARRIRAECRLDSVAKTNKTRGVLA